MNYEVNNWIDAHKEAIIESLCALLQLKSVKESSVSSQYPFGKGIDDALQYMLSLGRTYGFAAVNLDGYVGYIDSDCCEKEMIGVLTHLDVVPAGAGWTFPPFGGTVSAGNIYGRGAMDDKGAAIASFFAMLALKECHVPLDRRIRLIMGCDEESGLTCIDRYCKTETIPQMSFSPDGDYPLVNSEKNIFHAYYESQFPSHITIDCGERVNVVPPLASALVPFPSEDIERLVQTPMRNAGYRYCLSTFASGTKIEVFGKASHSSHPENGQNALQGLIYLLTFLPLTGQDRKIIHLLYDMFRLEYNGQALGLAMEDESGTLTANLGVMKWADNKMEMQLDIRAPLSATRELIEHAVDAKLAGSGIVCGSKTKFVEGLYVPEDSELIQKLLKAYREFTNDHRPPMKIGGGTYARRLPNAVAFGIEFPDRESVMHMPDEYISIEDLILDTKILANAMLQLA